VVTLSRRQCAGGRNGHRRVRQTFSALAAEALRLYDQLGLLPPGADDDSGYCYYAESQFDRARLIAALRHLQVSLAEIKSIFSLEPDAAAERISKHWNAVEAQHTARRDLAHYLVGRMQGRGMSRTRSPHGTSPPGAFCLSSAASKERTEHGRSARNPSRSCASTTYR
jgi:DNA-binding transcriptional MerR regulator